MLNLTHHAVYKENPIPLSSPSQPEITNKLFKFKTVYIMNYKITREVLLLLLLKGFDLESCFAAGRAAALTAGAGWDLADMTTRANRGWMANASRTMAFQTCRVTLLSTVEG